MSWAECRPFDTGYAARSNAVTGWFRRFGRIFPEKCGLEFLDQHFSTMIAQFNRLFLIVFTSTSPEENHQRQSEKL